MGASAVGLYWMKQAPVESVAQAEPPAAAQPRPPQPKFDFYNLLPEMEVVVPDSEVDGPASAPPARVAAKPPADTAKTETAAKAAVPTPATPAPPATPTTQETYLLQVGSFRRAEDAERLKAQMALQGIQVQIQQVTINGKDTFHRVRTVPLRGTQQLNDVRGRLRKSGVDSIVIKLKG